MWGDYVKYKSHPYRAKLAWLTLEIMFVFSIDFKTELDWCLVEAKDQFISIIQKNGHVICLFFITYFIFHQ